jgi:C4-dicarboxylate-specific signal transduction histidine kinase
MNAWPQRLGSRLGLATGLQLLLVAGSLSGLTYALGQRSGLQVSELYRRNASIRELSERLSQKLSFPRTINDLNLLEVTTNPETLKDFNHLSQVFWRQMQVFPVAYINYGSAGGEFIGIERTDDGQLLLNEDTPKLGRGTIGVYAMERNGKRGKLLETIPGMNAFHEEAWYADTVKSGMPTWSSIYSWEDKPEIFSISYNAPIYGPDQRLIGVIGVDMVLSQLSTWLQGVWQYRDGLALIVEPDGRLVASSRPSYTLERVNGRLARAALQNVKDPLAQELRRAFFEAHPAEPQALRTNDPERVRVGGHSYVIEASPWGRQEGLNWILLTAIAADSRATNSERDAWVALAATSAALAVALWVLSRLIRSLLLPLRQLQGAAQQLSQSLDDQNPQATLSLQSQLGRDAGEEMASLEASISQLVARFNTLTGELRQREESLRQLMERERYRDAQALALLKDKLRSSLEAAAVAHEINQPLSVLLLNSQLLLERARADDGRELPAAWREQLHSIRDEANRVVVTIEKMRSLLRNVQTEHQRLDLRAVAQSAVLYARTGTAAARLGIDSSGLDQNPAAPAWIEGDAAQIQIAIVNLLRNAAEAVAGSTTSAPWIGISLQREQEQWRLQVADNGPGFQGDATVVHPLHTTKSNGSGLGLFVVRTTMENHRGSVELGTSAKGGAQVDLVFQAFTTTG